jgi:hypothetical protein
MDMRVLMDAKREEMLTKPLTRRLLISQPAERSECS